MLNIKMSESEAYRKSNPGLLVDAYVDKLKDYDVISFDMFDTLIFRPFALPADLFFLIGEEFDILDFKNIRIWAESDARAKCKERKGHREVTLLDIWKNLEKDTGLSASEGMEKEQEIERKLCYTNPFMLAVWNRLLAMNKKLIVVSDMYLPEDCIAGILEKAGYTGMDKVYVSNIYQKSKSDGGLYREVMKDWRRSDKVSIVHVGDNPHSDRDMARQNGVDALPYPNIDKNIMLYRPLDMSPIVGSAYRAIVSGHLYNGLSVYGMEYEYGFIYGGLFVVGYCSFIHEYYKRQGLDKVLFLSRDGDILKQVYDFLYPEDSTEYVYWSRKAAVKLMSDEDKHDYFRRFIAHKINQNYTIAEILHSMELDSLIGQLADWKEIWLAAEKEEQALREEVGSKRHKKGERRRNEKVKEKKQRFLDLRAEDELTDKNGRLLRQFVEAKWEQVRKIYAPQKTAARKYYAKVLKDCGRVAVVDIGWAGSGAVALAHLVEKVWKLPCQVDGMIAGTNTLHNAEPEASEIFLQKGKLTAYLYSQGHNRDLLKKHDANKNYNVFWELLLSSPTPQFAGFYEGRRNGETWQYLEDCDITLTFGKAEENQDKIREIQKGIYDFAKEYQRHFKEFPYMFHISGRDAYAPMLVAASHHERYLRAIEKRFSFEKNII
ncbi:MAG: hypothetical protein NC407_10015 [Lachnoclostridium sp.]|nr:hypothetical protein [Lachnoclostridium sp.]